MDNNVSGKEITANLGWRFLERFGAQGVTFVVSLVLARILDPEVYGTVALLTALMTVLQVFVDSGLGIAVIQKKNIDDLDYSTIFYFNIIFSLLLYFLLFVSSPYIAKAYKNADLCPLIRVLGIIILIAGAKNVLHAYVSRNLLFKKFFFATLGGTLGAAVVGITMAYNGYGAWALIAQYLFNATIDTIILWITVKWYPKCEFSFERLKVLFSYGWKLMLSTLIDKLWIQLRQLIIGVKYSAEDLAFYNKGNEFPENASTAINSSIDSVLLPIMSRAQDNKEEVKQMTRRAITVSSYVIWPVMMGLAACAEPMIRLLIKEKWLFAVPYLRVFCITYAFLPIHTANLNAIKAIGRSDVFLKLEIIKKIVVLVLILSTMWISVYAMALSAIMGSVLGHIINSWPNRKFLNYSFFEQVKDVLPSMFMAIAMGLIVYSIQLAGFSDLVTLLIQIPFGVFIYVVLSLLVRYKPFFYCLSLVKKKMKKQ